MNLQLSADKILVQRALINAIRDAKEIEPVQVTVTQGTYTADCDEKSADRMANALLLWDGLGITDIDWTMTDNSQVTMTKAQLQEFETAVIAARGVRALLLHQYATGLKATLPVADDSTIFDGDTWTP